MQVKELSTIFNLNVPYMVIDRNTKEILHSSKNLGKSVLDYQERNIYMVFYNDNTNMLEVNVF